MKKCIRRLNSNLVFRLAAAIQKCTKVYRIVQKYRSVEASWSAARCKAQTQTQHSAMFCGGKAARERERVNAPLSARCLLHCSYKTAAEIWLNKPD